MTALVLAFQLSAARKAAFAPVTNESLATPALESGLQPSFPKAGRTKGETTMASSLVKLVTVNNLAAGQSTTRHWNNATPGNAVWYIQAVPLDSSFTSTSPAAQSVEVEVTRVWRKLNRTPVSSDILPWKYEHEIWYVIKNVGTREVDVDVYASIIS